MNDPAKNGAMDERLRALLVCPSCRAELNDVEGGLLCEHEGLLYPVVDGVPHLVRELARAQKSRTS